MNGNLEKLLHGNNVIMVEDMEVHKSEFLVSDKEKLHRQIRRALIIN